MRASRRTGSQAFAADGGEHLRQTLRSRPPRLKRKPFGSRTDARRRIGDSLLTTYIHGYIFLFVKKRASLFQNGGCQAVRLPKECRFADRGSDVLVRREGRSVVLEPVNEWSDEFRACLAARGESPAAFDRRCIPPGCVAPRSHTAGMFPRRAWPDGSEHQRRPPRPLRLGATLSFIFVTFTTFDCYSARVGVVRPRQHRGVGFERRRGHPPCNTP